MSINNLFIQLFIEWYRRYRSLFLKDQLLLLMLLECVDRAWRGEGMNQARLLKWEFFMSKQEYATFYIKEWKSGRIHRRLNRLQELGFIRKVNNKRGNKNATIYKLLPNDFMAAPWMMGNRIENWPKKPGNRIDTNKESIKENNEREVSPEDVEKLIASIKKTNEGANIPFNSTDQEWYVDKLLSDQIYFDVLVPLEKKFKHPYPRWELVAKIYKHAMTNKSDKFWNGKISSFKKLYEHLSDLANLF